MIPLIRRGLTASCLLVLPATWFALQISTASGWHYDVYRENLPQVSALVAVDDDVYASLETRQHDGRILQLGRLEYPDAVIAQGLQKPDGLAQFGGQLIYTQESADTPVMRVEGDASVALFPANSAEGIDIDEAGDVYIIEDTKSAGRILRFNPETGDTTVLFDGLIEGEGLCVMNPDELYFTEKTLGILYQLKDGELKAISTSLANPAYLHCDRPFGGLWITEDRTNFGRLLYLPGNSSEFEIIASGLHSPQSIVFDTNGDLLLAEQGRDRILRFSRQ